jgi:hypothetical protein
VSTVAAPFGLRPTFHPSGTIRPNAATIASGYNTNIFQFSPIGFIATGVIAMTAVGGTGVAGACGSFQGVEYTPTNGRRVLSNTWPANQVATEIVAYITQDPYITYAIQANASLTLAQAMGNQYDWTVNDSTAGNTTTGLSNVALDAASAAANASMRVVGLTPGPDNAYGDAFPILDVQLSEHQFVATVAAI